MLTIKQTPIRVEKPTFYGVSDEELEKVKLARLKRLQEFKRIERIYYPY